MIQLVLCDDNPQHNKTLAYHLHQLLDGLPLESTVALVTTEPEAVIAYARAPHEQTIYLLNLVTEKELNGLDMCRLIHEADPHGYIIYVSAYAEYAMECCRSHAFDFILKPYTTQRLGNSLRDVMREIARRKPAVPLNVTTGTMVRVLDQQSIRYLRSQREYVTAYLTDSQVTWCESMARLMERLNPSWFLRIHKSCVVNRLFLSSVDKHTHEVTLSDGTILPASRRLIRDIAAETTEQA